MSLPIGYNNATPAPAALSGSSSAQAGVSSNAAFLARRVILEPCKHFVTQEVAIHIFRGMLAKNLFDADTDERCPSCERKITGYCTEGYKRPNLAENANSAMPVTIRFTHSTSSQVMGFDFQIRQPALPSDS